MTWTRRSNRCFEVGDRKAKKQRGRRRRTNCFYRSDAEKIYRKGLTQRAQRKTASSPRNAGVTKRRGTDAYRLAGGERSGSLGAIVFMAMMDEHEFQRKSDAAFEALRRRLLELGDENEFEVEGGSGKLEIEFEDEDETRFVISPNAPVRQIWISALTTSFKLGWSDAAQAFVQEKTGETLNQVMSRILTEKLGTAIQV